MPKFGLKCFLGSFVFSLLMVFAVTKGYFVLTEKQPQPAVKNIESAYNGETVQSIELYTQNDEADKIYEKFKELSAPSQVQMPLAEDNQSADNQASEEYDDISDTLAFDGEQTGDIIYDPDEEDEMSGLKEKNKESPATKMLATEEFNDNDVVSAQEDNEGDELQLAAAEEAEFIIPLKHSFSVTTIGGASVSSETKDSQTALASQDVKSKTQLSDIKRNNDPWEVAAASNPYITKNKLAKASQKHKEDISALDKEKNSEATSEHETKVAYKMMKNILIPIPDEIANDENLTPQLSYSAENKKLDAKLKNKKNVEQEQKEKQKQAEKEKNKINDEQSKSLSDSITDWFAQGKEKEKIDVVEEDSKEERKSEKDINENEEDGENEGVFSRLLGLKKKNSKSIIPSELKLFFQPNRAEISGQTLEWLRAFSYNAVKDDEVMIEIRIDGSGSYELQQKRLNLLYTIFANNGVNYEKINIIFTARDPNSFIIRNVKYALENNTPKVENKKSGPWY